MSARTFPAKFPSRLDWDVYVLQRAIFDRLSFIHAYENAEDEEGLRIKQEAREEIEAMRKQIIRRRKQG